MYATITEIPCKSAADREQVVEKLEALHDEAKHLPGFNALYVIQTGEQALAMVTLYTSEEQANMVSGQARTHLGQVIGQHVSGPPRRIAGEIVLPR